MKTAVYCRDCFLLRVAASTVLRKSPKMFRSPSTRLDRTAFLFQTPFPLPTGSWKIAILFQNWLWIATGSWKTAILFQIPLLIPTGSRKIAILFQTLLWIATGSRKIAILFQTLLWIATGSWKTANLFQSSLSIPTGSRKIAILFQTLLWIATGSRKIAILFQTLLWIATGSGKTTFLFQISPRTLYTFRKNCNFVRAIDTQTEKTRPCRGKNATNKTRPTIRYAQIIEPYRTAGRHLYAFTLTTTLRAVVFIRHWIPDTII